MDYLLKYLIKDVSDIVLEHLILKSKWLDFNFLVYINEPIFMDILTTSLKDEVSNKSKSKYIHRMEYIDKLCPIELVIRSNNLYLTSYIIENNIYSVDIDSIIFNIINKEYGSNKYGYTKETQPYDILCYLSKYTEVDTLILFISNNNLSIVKYILENQVKDCYCHTDPRVSEAAVYSNNIDMIKYIVETPMFTLYYNLIDVATQTNNLEILQYMYDVYKLKGYSDLEIFSMNCLSHPSKNNNLKMIKFICDKLNDTNPIDACIKRYKRVDEELSSDVIDILKSYKLIIYLKGSNPNNKSVIKLCDSFIDDLVAIYDN